MFFRKSYNCCVVFTFRIYPTIWGLLARYIISTLLEIRSSFLIVVMVLEIVSRYYSLLFITNPIFIFPGLHRWWISHDLINNNREISCTVGYRFWNIFRCRVSGPMLKFNILFQFSVPQSIFGVNHVKNISDFTWHCICWFRLQPIVDFSYALLSNFIAKLEADQWL